MLSQAQNKITFFKTYGRSDCDRRSCRFFYYMKHNVIIDSEIALKLGVNSSIVFGEIDLMCLDTWSYYTLNKLSEKLSFLSKTQIRRCLNKLLEHNYICCFTGDSLDRTKYYYTIKKINNK